MDVNVYMYDAGFSEKKDSLQTQECFKPIPCVFVFIKSTGDLFHERVYFKFRKTLPSNIFKLN